MRFLCFLMALISLPLYAAPLSFRNDREGSSYYSGKSTARVIEAALREIDGQEIVKIYRTSLSSLDANTICAYDLNLALGRNLQALRPGFRDFKGAIHYLRSQNEIDDVVVRILLEAYSTTSTKVGSLARPQTLSQEKQKIQEMIAVLASFPVKFQKKNCFDEAYRSMVKEVEKIDPYLTSSQFATLFSLALNQQAISASLYTSLEQARLTAVDERWLNLKSYHQKIRSLRANKPLLDPMEKSEFVTDSFSKKQNVSRRMRLMENYSDIQIMLMAEVVKKLRMRVEADRAEILIYRKDELQDTVILEPMERFRMALKLLRKEMNLLGLNHYFKGRTPDYMDLMTASYEVGIVPASELAEIASLEEIWNPKKSFWEKSQTWIRSVGSLGTILLPPPFGFVPTLGIVVIELTTKKNNKKNENDPTSLF